MVLTHTGSLLTHCTRHCSEKGCRKWFENGGQFIPLIFQDIHEKKKKKKILTINSDGGLDYFNEIVGVPNLFEFAQGRGDVFDGAEEAEEGHQGQQTGLSGFTTMVSTDLYDVIVLGPH
jgi:hypothetical protein